MEDKIFSRIQALLSKTEDRGCTEAEASSAMAQVQRLLLEHNLSIEQVTQKGEQKKEGVVILGTTASYLHSGQWEWQLNLARCIAKVTCCKFLVQKGSGRTPWGYLWIGTPSNTQTASQMFQWVTHQMVMLAVTARQAAYDKRGKIVNGEYHSRYIGKNYLRSYLVGMATRVVDRLSSQFQDTVSELKAGSYVLARYDEAAAVERQHSGGTLKANTNAALNARGYTQGKIDGDKVKTGSEKYIDLGMAKQIGA